MEIYNKLVRDKIPDIIEKSGSQAITRILNQEEYKTQLEKKLFEEYNEVLLATEVTDRIEELADMLEVIDALANIENKTLTDVIKVKEEKKLKRGGFKEKIFLESVLRNEKN